MVANWAWLNIVDPELLWEFYLAWPTSESLQLGARHFANIGNANICALSSLYMGLSENRVYSQKNSHLIGIMISKTIGFRGTLFSDTPIWASSHLRSAHQEHGDRWHWGRLIEAWFSAGPRSTVEGMIPLVWCIPGISTDVTLLILMEYV